MATWSFAREVTAATGGSSLASRTYVLGAAATSVTAGNLLVSTVGPLNRTVTSITSTTTNPSAIGTWTVTTSNVVYPGATIAFAIVQAALTATDSITVNMSGAAAPAVTVVEFGAGATITAASVDKSSANGATGSTTYNSNNTATLTNPDDLIVSFVGFDNGTGTNTITPEVLSPAWQTPTTAVQSGAGTLRYSMRWRDPQATTAVRAQGTMSGVASDYDTLVVAITVTTSGAAPGIPMLVMAPPIPT